MSQETVAAPGELRAMRVDHFMAMDLPKRDMVMGPVLSQGGLAMVYAPRGLGKTYFALSFAYAVATGGTFLNWRAEKPRSVLYIDGEMPAALMKERLNQISAGAGMGIADGAAFKIITPEFQGDRFPDISTLEGQGRINLHLVSTNLLVLDNLASLHLAGAENEGDSWLLVQSWLLMLRRTGRSVLIVHHSGKGGQQRGTSRREDILDTVIALRRPSDYAPDQGARFEVHLEKARGIYGDDTLPFEARLQTVDGAAQWSTKPLEDVDRAKVIALAQDGLTVREICEETGLGRGKVGRIHRDAVERGELENKR